MFWVFVALVLFAIAGTAPWLVSKFLPDLEDSPLIKWGQIGAAILGVWAILSTSYVNVGDQEFLVLKKTYGWTSLTGEHVIAANGEKGVQSEMITPGFHFSLLINVIYTVEHVEVTHIPSGKYGYLTALDGAPLRTDQFLADQFPAGHEVDMLDANYFLTHGGQRGPQSSVVPPGNWRINPYLFKVEMLSAIDIPTGYVGVVKSNFLGAVDFGSLVAPKPASCSQKTVSANVAGHATSTDKDAVANDPGKLTAILVPIGCIGVWDKALDPGRYYVNEHAYTIIQISTRVQTWEFKGGYTKRFIDLTLDQKGNLEQKERSEVVEIPKGVADRAVIPRIEGWEVPQELRVLAQVTPDNAPFVVAAVGGIEEIEKNIMVPTIRSIVRNVLGAEGRKVLDLADNRAAMEQLVETAIRPEGLRAGIVIKEVKFGDPALPPELLVSRLRQQLAGQLQATYKQEQQAQENRIATEQARATADQQPQLVRAQIGVQTAEQEAKAAALRGQGQRQEMEAVAAGQAAQSRVLGEDRVMILSMAEKILAAVREHPDILSSVSRFVPVVSVNTGNEGGGLSGAASILGTMLGAGRDAAATAMPAPARH